MGRRKEAVCVQTEQVQARVSLLHLVAKRRYMSAITDVFQRFRSVRKQANCLPLAAGGPTSEQLSDEYPNAVTQNQNSHCVYFFLPFFNTRTNLGMY
jgi:hypothetical protein